MSDFNPGISSSPKTSNCRNTDKSGTNSHSSQPSTQDSSKNENQSFRKKNSNIRFLVLNANSVKGKSAELEHILDYVKPDIVIISETKIDKSIYSSEFLPKN